MEKFMGHDFLLDTETAKKLYHDYAENMPIIDYHCHLNPKEIYEDRKYENIAQVWLEADHYKWRQMRSNGVEERYITGDAEDREKFQKWAETLEMAIGNPLYHWSHMELKNYFDYEGVLNSKSAEQVWNLCNKRLERLSARQLILKSGVEILCTTDDPTDSLEWHLKLKEDDSFGVRVLPTWRPDRVINIEKKDFKDYIEKLAKVSKVHIKDFASLLQALWERMDLFEKAGCCISDHGLEYVPCVLASEEEIETIFQKGLRGDRIIKQEELKYKTALMLALGKLYNKKGWVMQIHYGVRRDNHQRVFERLGADAGIDCIYNYAPSSELAGYLNELAKIEMLPKTILYSLNPSDNAVIGSIIGCFQDSSSIGKVQHGSAWWFNDHKEGMKAQMISLANLGLLGNFIGMLTDSRSFLSYARHEYFRRILCSLIGEWVEKGEYPEDYGLLEKIVKGISCNNAKRYFGFDKGEV